MLAMGRGPTQAQSNRVWLSMGWRSMLLRYKGTAITHCWKLAVV
jgi:hypothetical protein